MLVSRTRVSENISKRQGHTEALEMAASGVNVPLGGENWLERWCTIPPEGETYIRQIYNFEVRDDDVYLATFPKCGCHWMTAAIWLLMNNLDFSTANTVDLRARSHFLELTALYPSLPYNTVELAKEAISPRILKSHLPAHLLPKQIWDKRSKIVFCARNPKDMAVSYYHFGRGCGTWEGNIDEFVEDLINNDIMFSPYWDHLRDFWQMRHEKNVFFTTFEEMKRDLRKVLIELNRFLEKPPLKQEELTKLAEHLSFNHMKSNPHINPTANIHSGHGSPNVRSDFEFMRRGIVGSFKDELSEEAEKKLDEWTNLNLKKFNVSLKDIFGEI